MARVRVELRMALHMALAKATFSDDEVANRDGRDFGCQHTQSSGCGSGDIHQLGSALTAPPLPRADAGRAHSKLLTARPDSPQPAAAAAFRCQTAAHVITQRPRGVDTAALAAPRREGTARRDRKWPLNDGQSPNPNVVRVAPGAIVYEVPSCRGGSAGVAKRPRERHLPPEIPTVTIRNFSHRCSRQEAAVAVGCCCPWCWRALWRRAPSLGVWCGGVSRSGLGAAREASQGNRAPVGLRGLRRPSRAEATRWA